MTDTIRPSKSAWLRFDQIDLPDNGRPYSATEVVALASSIRAIGLLTPLTVVERGDRYQLVAGRHRLEALRLVKADKVPCRIADLDDVDARLWTISENLHRTELTVTQRAGQIAEWIKLTEARQVAQVAPAVLSDGRSAGPQHAPSGVRAAARELGIDRDEARRAIKIASITPVAKAAAREAGLEDNQSALLKVASYADEDQVEAVATIAERKSEPMPEPRRSSAPPLRNLENMSGGELARWIKITTPNDRPHVVRVLRMAADILEAGQTI